MLHVFVEGPDDERFFSKVYGETFGEYKFIQYAGLTPQKINNYLHSINCMPNSDYLFFCDADGCEIEKKKSDISIKYSCIDKERVFVVQYEIESWYYSGASPEKCQKLKLKQYVFNTDNFTKEHFNARIPRRGDRKIIMALLLEEYAIDLAITRNTSLAFFNSCMK